MLELGSGVSTLVAAQALRRKGSGHITSLEHDAHHAARTTQLLHRHGLADWADVVHAPLREYTIRNKKWNWYGVPEGIELGTVDLLIVDGPPGRIWPKARYPALPVLIGHLSETAVILLDDAARPDEQRILDHWAGEHPEYEAEYVACERGLAILRRRSTSRPVPEKQSSN